MPNPLYNNMHGPNRTQGKGASNESRGSRSSSGSEKVAAWPGLPGKTQSKDRSAGQPKSGWKGNFRIKAVGL